MPIPRPTARLLVVDASGRVLLFRCGIGWITPGGGLRPGEALVAAAVRELREETGLRVTEAELGRPVAVTSGPWSFGAEEYHGTDWFFVLRTAGGEVDVSGQEELERSVLSEHRWWTLAELAATGETVYPIGLAGLLRRLSAGDVPAAPVALPWRPGEPAPWSWDETLYAGSAAYYPIGRLPYPEVVVDTLRATLGLDGRDRLLDLGCGPGSLTLPLAPLFAEVVGLDADGDMLARARAEAAARGIGNIRWVEMRAEELPAGLGRFRVITFAQSFHWFDRPLVAGLIRQMLAPGGACVHVQATTHRGVGDEPLPWPRPPRDDVPALVARYLGPQRRAGRGILPDGTASGEAEILRAAGFRGPERVEVGGGIVHERTEDEVVASVFSQSIAAPHLFGDRLSEFEADLRALLRRASPDGRFAERQREIALDVWWPA